MITNAVLPNGLTYIFQYDGCGSLTKIVYPSGGYTRYVFDYSDYTHGVGTWPNNTTATDIEVVKKYVCRAAAVSPGATSTGTGNTCPVGEDLTTYTPTLPSTCNNSANTVVDPLGNTTAYQFTNYQNCSYGPVLESQRQVYQGSSTLLRTVQTQYTGVYPSLQTTILANTLENQVQWDYWSVSKDFVKEKREYGWGNGSPGTLVRTTDYGQNYCYDKPPSETVYAGSSSSGTEMAQTTYEFDNYTGGLSQSGAVEHGSTNPTLPTRCNNTAIQRWRNTDGATLTTRMQYDDAGNVLSATDPLGYQTTTSYADVWGNGTCSPTGGNAAAYPTQVTDPAGLITKHSYNSCTGTVASSTDPNNEVTNLSYDLMDRLVQTTFPDAGQTSSCFSEVSGGSCYSSVFPLKVVSSQKITSSVSKVSTAVLDGLARVTQTQLNSDPDGVTYVDTTYDSVERKATVSNPYRSTGDTTYGITTYNYDPLDRVTKLIPPDGSGSSNNVSTTYDILLSSSTPPANCMLVTDQTGKSRKPCSDGLDRLTQVFEDPSGVNYETDYQYDVLNNLVRVDQKGTAPTNNTQWRTRTFTYNSLSQLLCAANPEVTPTNGTPATCPTPDTGTYTPGTIRYGYDNDGNMITKTSPKPNQTSSSTTVVTTYTYNDPDNRLTMKSYNDGTTPTAKFAYDGGALSGCPGDAPPADTDSYPKSRRTAMCDASGGTSWTHDKMGRILQERRSIAGVTGKYDNDSYNLDGSVASLIAIGYQLNYTYSSAGRLITATNTADSFNYVTSAHYAPFGGLTSMSMGAKPVTITDSYNNRLQPTLISASTTAATIMSLCYDFHSGTAINASPCSFSAYTSGNNGNVYQIVNNRDSNRTQNFLYDSLNRISQAYTSGTNWGETYSPNPSNPGVQPSSSGIDAWGNLWARSAVTGKTLTEGLNCPPNTQNQPTACSLTYDAAGNVMQDTTTTTYTYDAENRLIATAGISYIYDGDGNRVKKCTQGSTPGTCASGATGTMYWRGTNADPLVETDLSGNIVENYVFFGGRRIARREPGTPATIHLYFSDHLGSHDIITDASGDMPPQHESDYFPYGGDIPQSGSDPNHYKFTGKERDTESGLDYFGARYNASSLGRFMGIDEGKPHPENPQSWNKYAFTLNNPLAFIDPDGREAIDVAVFWLTRWVPTGHTYAPGSMLPGPSEELSFGGLQRTPEVGTPRPNNGNTWQQTQGTPDTSEAPFCPPACTTEYHGVDGLYRLVADFKTDAHDSSKSSVTLSEVLAPESGSISGPYGNPTRWWSGVVGPPPDFKTTVNVRALAKLSDQNLAALDNALSKAIGNNGYDEAIYETLTDTLIEEGRRVRKQQQCKKDANQCTR